MEPLSMALALAQYAPSIMRFFGAGQASADVAQAVAQVAQSVTGAKTPQEALDAMRVDAKLAQDFNLAVLAADRDLESAYLLDRQSARQRDVEYVHAGRHNTRADVLAAGAVVGLLACLALLVVYRTSIPDGAMTLITTIASIFGVCLRDVFSFEFGSSRGSKEKDEVLAHAARGGTP